VNPSDGSSAVFKKIFLVDFDEVDTDGFLVKHQVADLLHLDDPKNVAGFGPTFRFPFQTIESVTVLERRYLGCSTTTTTRSAPAACRVSPTQTSSSSSSSIDPFPAPAATTGRTIGTIAAREGLDEGHFLLRALDSDRRVRRRSPAFLRSPERNDLRAEPRPSNCGQGAMTDAGHFAGPGDGAAPSYV